MRTIPKPRSGKASGSTAGWVAVRRAEIVALCFALDSDSDGLIL